MKTFAAKKKRTVRTVRRSRPLRFGYRSSRVKAQQYEIHRVLHATDAGSAENRTGLPDPLKASLEQLSGMDLAGVRVHQNSSKPAELDALAYAHGQEIHVGPGQERHLPHEGWHAVQQMQGRVRPTIQAQDVSLNDDDALEREADVMGTKALQPLPGLIEQPQNRGWNAPLLGQHAGTAAGRGVIQAKRVKGDAKAGAAPRAEDLVAAEYPHLARVLEPKHYQAIQNVINWRIHRQKVGQKIADFKKRERKKAARQGIPFYAYTHYSSYNRQLDRLYARMKDAPDVTDIEVDTSKLIDRAILDPQDWNVQAEKEFRQRWVRALASKPTILEILDRRGANRGAISSIYWKGYALPTDGGLITWKKLLNIRGAWQDYQNRVRNSPVARAARDNLKQLRHWYDKAQSAYDFERERKAEYPVVSRISEFFSSSIDWKAAAKLLPKGKRFKDMGIFEISYFLNNLDQEQLEKVIRTLPSSEKVLSIYKHLLNVDTAVVLGKYEAALITMPLVADEIETMYRRVMAYRQRTLEGASTVITGLQAVRTGCNIVLTIGGGVMGKAYGLIGISAGSAAGAGIGTFTQETAKQLAEGDLDPGSVLFKTGKDAAMTFIGSMIGGALASKFIGVLGPRLAKVIPNEGVRMFVIGRVADASSGLLTAPIEVTLTGMLEGNWPKSMDDLLDKVAKNVVQEVIVGGAVDVVTGVPNLKGKEWDKLVAADIGMPSQGRLTGPLAGLGDAEIDAALSGQAWSGTMVRGPAGAETGQSLVNLKVVSRLNDEVRSLTAGRGLTEPPGGAAFELSQIEIELAHRILANPYSPPNAVNQALEAVVQRAVADYRAFRLADPDLGGRGKAFTAKALRGACGPGRDVTADSIASLTLGSRSPLVVHRIQAAHLGINAQHAFTVIIKPDGSGFLVDPTFAQFTDQISGRSFTSKGMLSDPRAVSVARNLLRDGFVPLTPANARDYALGLGARADQAEAVAARIASGDASILTEVIHNGRVSRISARPAEAENTLALPIDADSPQAGTIHRIEQMLARLAPNDPLRPGLASLRDRLIMISAEQQQVTARGIGARPGGR